MENNNTTFILGNPRSGTSLFRLMLNSHPNIVCPPESGFGHWWLAKYNDWSITDLESTRLNDFLRDLFSSKKFETWYLNKEEVREFILKRRPEDYAGLISCIYLAYGQNPDEIKVLADKNNYYIHHIEDLEKIWPNSKYIHIIRDARDVACSYIDNAKLRTDSPYKPDLSTDIDFIANEWCENNQKIAFLKKSNPENYLLVKYEDLILNTMETLVRCTSFLNVDFSDQMLNYFKNSDVKKIEPIATIDWKRKTMEKPDKNRVKRYLTDLDDKQQKRFLDIAKSSLEEYGYE